ncbi:unnamed protein product [Didymodactylos carnosus]|uniref:Tetratricopeptide repeat protein n=2 Tax=Didymodactylos carnosus TaxID=1234261 RepID=A0A815Y316_9BILA|nr:unnamed protein product [Didymodactylos carnosus]CAF4427375.1 unnamed protein product [Didymodactylos carnosus]
MSTSINENVALTFAKAREDPSDESLLSVLFKITIDSRIRSQECPFASIENKSKFREEEEILISVGSIFRVKEPEKLPDGMWRVHLIFTGAEDQQLKAVTNLIRTEIESPNEMIRLAKLMIQMGEYEMAERFYKKLLKSDMSSQKQHCSLSLIYNDLGLIYMKKNENQKALKNFSKSLELLEKYVPNGAAAFATRYNNIGSVYYNLGEWQEALDNYKQALDINLHAGANSRKAAVRYRNIGRVLYKKGQYSKALEMYEKTLDIELKNLPRHPSMAYTYNNMGLAFDGQCNYQKSENNLKRAIEISRNTLPANHPLITNRQGNLANVQQKLKGESIK